MYYNTASEDIIKANIEELKNRPHQSLPAPRWHTGLGTEILNIPARAYDKLVAPLRPNDEESLRHQGAHPSRSDPNTMGIAAHLVEGLSDLAPFLAGAQIAGRALSLMPTPITKIAGFALSGVSGLALKYAPRVAGAVSKVATAPNVGGALYSYLSHKAETSYLHQAQGLDKETAEELAWRGALVHAAALLTPAAIASKSVAKTLASGAGLNIPFGMVERGWSSKVLEDNGHPEMAKHYRVFDMEALMTDGLIGVFFGGMHSKQVQNMSLRLIRDLKDGITDRLIYKHAVKSSSPHLHTSYEAHKAHMDTLAHGVDSLAKGEHPTFDKSKLKTIVENSIEDPHFKSHLPEAEPQPQRREPSDSRIDKQKSDKQQADREYSNKQPSDKHHSDRQQSDKRHTDKEHTDREYSDREQFNKQQADRRRSDRTQSDKHQIDKHQIDKHQIDKQIDKLKADFTGASHAKEGIATFTEHLSNVDEHASQRFAGLEERSPGVASEVHEGLQEKAQLSKVAEEKSLFNMAIDCFVRTGGYL